MPSADNGPPAASFAPIEEAPPTTTAQQPPAPPAPTPVATSEAPVAAGPPASPGATPTATPLSTSTTPDDEETEGDDEESKYGHYLDLDVGAVYGIQSTHGWNDTCPQVSNSVDPSLNYNPTCKMTPPIGAFAEGRLGVRFGLVAFEGFGLGSIDWSSASLTGDEPPVSLPAFVSGMQMGRIGGAFGAGLRLMGDGFVRVTAGAGGGMMLRYVFTNVTSLDGSSTSYTAPLVKADLTLNVGKLLNFGILGWVEFAPTVKVKPDLSAATDLAGIDLDDPNLPAETRASIEALDAALGQVTVYQGPQYFVGPYVGFHFGK